MEKAAEVYTRLKSRVLGPKIEAIQKAARTGAEKERAEAEKAEEALGGEEAPSERAEDEASAGEELGGASRAPRPRWRGRRGPLVFSGRPGSVPKASGAWCTHTRALPGGSGRSEPGRGGGRACTGWVCVSSPGGPRPWAAPGGPRPGREEEEDISGRDRGLWEQEGVPSCWGHLVLMTGTWSSPSDWHQVGLAKASAA